MTKQDIAQIARMGEQIQGLRDDVVEIKENMRRDNSEIKKSISDFTVVVEKQTELYVNSIREISERHYTKEEIGLMVQARDNQEKAQDREIDELVKAKNKHEERLSKLEKKWAWLTGVGALAVLILGAVEAAIRFWKG